MPKEIIAKKYRTDVRRLPIDRVGKVNIFQLAQEMRSSTTQDNPPAHTAPESPAVFSALPFIERYPRPSRWRRRQTSNGEQSLHTNNGHQVKEFIQEPTSSTAESTSPGLNSQDQGKIKLRFSFAASKDDFEPRNTAKNHKVAPLPPSRLRHPTELLDLSFSSLSFDGDNEAKPTEQCQYSKVAVNSRAKPTIPELIKPKKERKGYGFSFSDSMFYDSDDYPDTECEWEPETEETPPASSRTTPNLSTQGSTLINHTALNLSTPGSSMTSHTTANLSTPGSSFADIVVVRDVGSFHIAKPQKRLPCTTATREDTILVKRAAKLLFKYDESADIYANLVGRLERMVYAALEKWDAQTTVPIGTNCALKLCSFLLRTAAERVETGENQRVVEHEIEWAQWLVIASRTGVMHLKGPGCKCRPDWEE